MKYTLRIKKNKTFRYILKKGEFSRARHIVIHILKVNFKNNNKNFFGICVSKKNGNAVHRNKLKRWAREVYKEEETNIKKGYNVIIMYKKGVTRKDVDFWKIKEEFIKCLKELDIYEQQIETNI